MPAATGAGWWNKVDGRITSRHRLKSEAIAAGSEMARGLRVEHTIHREDEQTSETNVHEIDPCAPTDER